MIHKEIDILIVGGGLTGATLMLALRGLGFNTLLVDAQPFEHRLHSDFDARSLALAPSSMRILKMLGIWEYLQDKVSPINTIHVSDQHHFGASRLHAEPNKPLGYVVEMHDLNSALHQLLDQQHFLAPAKVESVDKTTQSVKISTESGEMNIVARLIVAADGTRSEMRHFCELPSQTKLYLQEAIVANIGLLKAHKGLAYERFTADGPLALLPMQDNRMSLVWAMPPKEAQKIKSLSDAEFLQRLQEAFGYRLGRFVKVGKRSSFPLQQILMPKQVKGRVVFVGNAAHTLHPVAGQGFNLGLRDVATLAQCIAKLGLNEGMLAQYAQLRAQDQKAIARFTDGLINVFTNRFPGLGLVRGLGLIALDTIPALKNILARYARGFGGVIPDLVCEIALEKKGS